MLTLNTDKPNHIAGALLSYIQNTMKDPSIEYESLPTPLEGGYETAIYQFRVNHLEKETHKRCVLRLFPAFRPPENAVREYVVQNAMAREGYPVARTYCLCTDTSVLGGAFYVMDFLTGESMMSAPIENLPAALGKIHARLHKIDPGFLIKSLKKEGAGENIFEENSRLSTFETIRNDLPGFSRIIDWLTENSPPVPDRQVICHGDFHPRNILMKDGKVTGVIDWPDFRIGDPALDVANTIWLITFPFKYVILETEPELASIDWDDFAEQYLAEYKEHVSLNSGNINFYKVLRSVRSMWAGHRGQELFRNPEIVKSIAAYVNEVTGISIETPE